MATPTTKVSAGKDNKVRKFLREVRAELRKVQWPNRKELTTYTVVVLFVVIVVAVFTGIIDLGFSEVMRLLGRFPAR